MATPYIGKVTSYDLTTGVIVDMDEAIYMVSPTDSPMITGVGADGLSVLSSRPTNERKVEWMDEEILTPRSTVGSTCVTAATTLTVATGDGGKFSSGDILMLGAHVEWVQVVDAVTSDVLTIDRSNPMHAGTASQHVAGAAIVAVGTALVEGSDPEAARSRDRDARFNYTQIFGPTKVEMSRTEAKVGKYGVADEFNHQLMNRITENVIAREQAYLYGQRAQSTTVKNRALGGLYYYIAAQGNVDTTASALSVTLLQTAQQACYNDGKVPDRGMGNPAQIKNITDAVTLSTINEARSERARGREMATFVDTEFGRLTLVRNRWALTSDFFMFTREDVVRRIFDTLQFEWLAKTGDSKKGQIVCEESLEVRGAQHQALFSALT